MRLMNLYVVLDTRARVIIGNIIQDYNPVTLIRNIQEAVTKPDTLIGRNPEDFIILHIGQIDDETGRLHLTSLETFHPGNGNDVEDSVTGRVHEIARALALKAAQA